MNYEQKYKEVLERAKRELQTCGSKDCDAARQIYRFFPELQESEDERIRKAIITFFESEDDNTTYALVPKKDILAWLEKQDESKYIPKYRIGDYVKNTNYKGEPIYEIIYMDKECYICEYRGKERMGDKAVMHFSFDNPYLRLVQKPADTEKGAKGNEREIPNFAWSEEDEEKMNWIIATLNNCSMRNSESLPMNESCEDWLKSLRPQKQQQEDEWSEEDKEFLGLTLSNLAELKDRYGEGYGKVGKCIDWLKSLQPQPINVEAAIAYQDGYQKALVEFSKKHQEWTEDDIEMIDRLIRHCEKEHEELCNDRYGHQEIVSDLKKSCRERWDWLESLRNKVVPQKQWKPSDEQMEQLNIVSTGKGYFDKRLLKEMYEQLKKLKG